MIKVCIRYGRWNVGDFKAPDGDHVLFCLFIRVNPDEMLKVFRKV